MDFLKINGQVMPNPQAGGYSVTTSDLDSESTTRSETGMLNRDRVRENIYKIMYKCLVTTDELEKVANATSPVKFDVTFFFCGDFITKEMYAGDKTVNFIIRKDDTEYWEFSCNFIEY